MIAVLCLFFETYARPCYFLAVSHPIGSKFTAFCWKNKCLDTNTEHSWRLLNRKFANIKVLAL